MNTIKKLFLLLCLIMVGVQSASAWLRIFARDTVEINGVIYETILKRAYLSTERTAYIIGISSSSYSLTIPREILHDEGGVYSVAALGQHVFLRNYPHKSYYNSDQSGLYMPPFHEIDDLINREVTVTNNYMNELTFSANGSFFGNFNSTSLTTLNFQKNAYIASTLNVPNLWNLNIEGELEIRGTISSNSLTNIYFNKLTCKGKFDCPSLQNVYFTNNSVSFKGQWEDCFTAPRNTVVAHVYDKTDKEIAALRNTAVWDGFKQIVNHKSNISYTLVNNNNGNATVSFLGLEGNASYVSASSYLQYDQILSGSTSGTVKSGGNYAVEIKDVNFNTKDVTLTRNGVEKTLQTGENQGDPVMFFEDLDLQSDVTYEVMVKDKQCTLNFEQTGGHTGKIIYSKTVNGQTYSGSITSNTASVTCSRGTQVKLTIPYDQYTPDKLYLGTNEVTMTKAGGTAVATLYVPVNSLSADVTLSWQAPQQTYEYHVPQITILRSGDGDVHFEGLNAQQDEWRVVKSVDCVDDLTVVSVPDADLIDDYDWGFRLIVTPAKGQIIRSLKMGHLDLDYEHYDPDEGYRTIMYWEDALIDDPLYLYCHDDGTGTYTLNIEGQYDHGWGAGDFTLLVAMGPEESTVETGQKLSFVRKGGRGDSYIAWNFDGPEPHFPFAEGSTSTTIPDEELQGNDLQMFVNTEEGETFHVYKDGMDITGQFQLNGQSTTQYWAPLEAKSASYTLLIEEAPDANPTWTVVQHDNIAGTQIVVSSAQGNETINCDDAKHELTIDDSNVTKVQLLVAASCVEGCIPVRVLKNGMDVSYQYSDYDGEVLTYEVPVAMLYNTTWDISYNTDLQQTFIIKGGGREPAMTVEYENLHGSPTLNFSSYGGPQSFYLPPFDEENNEEIKMKVFVNANEKATIFRNGNEVTGAFDPKTDTDGKYYELIVSDALFANNNTLSTLGFDIREAATWEITIEAACTDVHAYAAGGTVSMKKILADNSVEALGGGGSDCLRTLNDGEGVQIGFTPSVSGKELTKLIVSNSNVDLTNDSRLVKEADGNYTFTLTSEELIALAGKKKEINVFAEFEGAVEKTGVDYMFIGDFAYIHAAVDGNGDVTYEGSDIEEENVVGYYIGKVIENGSGIGQQGCVEFKLPNATDTFRAYRDGVDMTHLFGKNDYDGMILFYADGLDDWMHEPSQWVIINESELVKYDVNRDHEINISDVTKLVNKIIGKE